MSVAPACPRRYRPGRIGARGSHRRRGASIRRVASPEDASLIGRYLESDSSAVAEIDGWLTRAATPFRARLGADWEDAVQEVRLETFRLLEQGRFRGESRLRTYLWQVAAHGCINALRRQQRRRRREAPEPDEEPEAPDGSPVEALERRERRVALLRLLEEMSAECRELWGLILDGRSYGEISGHLGVTEGALRVRAHRCRKRAAAALAGNAKGAARPSSEEG